MAKNDAILLDGIIQDQMSGRGLDKGEAFELFAFEQILKSFDLSQPEICLLYTSPSPRDGLLSRMPSSA